MVTSQITFTEFCPVIGRKGVSAFCLFVCTLGLGLSASAQETAPARKTKGVVLQNFVNPPRGAYLATGAIHFSASAIGTAPALNTKEVVLHNFVSPPQGAYPAAGVIRDFAGNLYGTTNGAYSDVPGGGVHNAGVVFKVDTCGNETVLYTFTGGADGSSPNGLIRDLEGNLYGTTSGGGASGVGVVFKVDAAGNETVLYTFTGGADGSSPNSLIRDSAGNLYGTTNGGGVSGAGVVFKVDPLAMRRCCTASRAGTMGQPLRSFIRDLQGNLYGTTNGGGNAGAGVVFKIDTSGHETVLYTFTGGNDGAFPNGVIRDLPGNLYGTTSNGGALGAGVVFKVDTSGNETVLYTFTGGNDGGYSDAGVIRDWAGNLYGTTALAARRAWAWCSKSIRPAMRRYCTLSCEGLMGTSPTSQAWFSTRSAIFTGLPPSVAPGVMAWCTSWMRAATRRSCTPSRVRPMGSTPTTLVSSLDPTATSTGLLFMAGVATASFTNWIGTAMRRCCTASTSSPPMVLANQPEV